MTPFWLAIGRVTFRVDCRRKGLRERRQQRTAQALPSRQRRGPSSSKLVRWPVHRPYTQQYAWRCIALAVSLANSVSRLVLRLRLLIPWGARSLPNFLRVRVRACRCCLFYYYFLLSPRLCLLTPEKQKQFGFWVASVRLRAMLCLHHNKHLWRGIERGDPTL